MNKTLKIILSTLLALFLFVVFVFGGYVVYLCTQYYRIEDNLKLDIANNQLNNVQAGTEYSISTYNIGFGAYTQDYTFFMDSGEMLDGTKTKGVEGVAKSKESVLECTNGAINTIKALSPDFSFFQEVDTNSTRSHHVNQYSMIQSEFGSYGSSNAVNFHSAFLFYPLTAPHGTSNSSIVTFSKYQIKNGVRRSFPVDNSFPNKFFDLDRCFAVYRLKVANSQRELVLVNLHMSAYDEGGKIRAKQLEMLTSFLKIENQKGNYVIAGGDWNHDIADSATYFKSQQKKPDWVGYISKEDIPENFSFASNKNAPTCRSSDIPYTKDENGDLINYSVVIDGFLVSSNVEVVSVQNIDTEFKYSDHNPVFMKFVLKTA